VNAVGPHPFWGGRPQALHVAIETKRRDMFDLLVEQGADVDGSNEQYDHWSPVMLTINREQIDMRDELLRQGAYVGLLEALMLADDERVRVLLDAEGLPDVTPNAGSILAFARTPYAIDRLIALGAPIDMKDRWDATPIEAMSRLGSRGAGLVGHMAARGALVRPEEFARLGDRQALEQLVATDPSVARGDAVMMAAVDFKHHGLVEWLLAKGGNVNARSSAASRHTALHSAAWNGDLGMVKLLIAAGADPTARDATYDATPQGWASTSIDVSNNPACAEVAAYLGTL
jgi:ankyrin repeat protein